MKHLESIGIRIIESPLLPYDPSPGEWARRYVRHGMSDVLEWLGEPVGPKPDEQTHMFMFDGMLMASAVAITKLREIDSDS